MAPIVTSQKWAFQLFEQLLHLLKNECAIPLLFLLLITSRGSYMILGVLYLQVRCLIRQPGFRQVPSCYFKPPQGCFSWELKNKNATGLQSVVKFLAHQVVLFHLHLLADYIVMCVGPHSRRGFLHPEAVWGRGALHSDNAGVTFHRTKCSCFLVSRVWNATLLWNDVTALMNLGLEAGSLCTGAGGQYQLWVSFLRHCLLCLFSWNSHWPGIHKGDQQEAPGIHLSLSPVLWLPRSTAQQGFQCGSENLEGILMLAKPALHWLQYPTK